MADSSSKSLVTIIGTGALGTTLQRFFEENGYLVQSAWSSEGGSVYSDELSGYEKVKTVLPEKEEEIGELIFITTPDDWIQKTAQVLSNKSISWEKKVVIHCSGNLTSDELSALAEPGAKTVSMHPIQSFKRGDESDRFKDITISLQGDEEAKDLLKPIIKEMGAHPLMLDKKQKRNLHIAAVMASNYLVALMFSVENLLKEVDLKDGFKSLEPLVHQTVKNIFEKGPSEALTGPISRGDVESVQTHLEELKGRDQEKLYKNLGVEAIKITEKSGNISHSQVEELKFLLNEIAK